MASRLDHLEEEMAAWQSREQRFEKLFGAAILKTRTYQKEELAMYEGLEIRYGGSDLGSTGSKLIRQRRREIEKKLYPHFGIRLIYRLAKSVLPGSKPFAYEKALQQNYKALHEQVRHSGFTTISEKQIETAMRQGNREFTIPVSYFVSEKEKMDYNLKFVKDQTGDYKLEQYQATYQHLDAKGETKVCTFHNDHSLEVNARQAYNLLAGRSICSGTHEAIQKWVQLDFNDKDAIGNFKMKIFPPEYGFDLNKSLTALSLDESVNYFSRMTVLNSLMQGERMSVTSDKGKVIDIEANPQKQKLDVYEKGLLKISEPKIKTIKPDFEQTRQAEMKLIKQVKSKAIRS